MKRVFGRIYVPDSKDKKFSLAKKRKGLVSQRKSRYWNDGRWFADQGATSSCVGHAWAHWLDCAPFRQYLNPHGIYSLAKFQDAWEGEDYDGTSVRAGAKVLQTLGFIESYQWAMTTEQIVYAVLEIGPVVVGTDWYEGMSTPDHRGLLTLSGDFQGGHAWIITGVNVDKRLFRMKNSWGLTFGKHGRGWISFNAMAALLKDNGEVCLGVERKAKAL